MLKIEVNGRSAWAKGVKLYADELVEKLEANYDVNAIASQWELQADLLNGALNWKQYSEGGCALIYDKDIAERLCSPSELKRTNYGERRPNPRETWLECQARALNQAACLVEEAWRKARA